MNQHPTARDLLREAERFMHRAGMSATAFGIGAVNDGNFIPRLRRGRTPTLDTIDKVRRYIRKQDDVAARRRG